MSFDASTADFTRSATRARVPPGRPEEEAPARREDADDLVDLDDGAPARDFVAPRAFVDERDFVAARPVEGRRAEGFASDLARSDLALDDLLLDDLRPDDFVDDLDLPPDFFPLDDEPPERPLPRDEPLDFAFAIEPPSCLLRRVDCVFYHTGAGNGNVSVLSAQFTRPPGGETCAARRRQRV
jgi:hypothetical protein